MLGPGAAAAAFPLGGIGTGNVSIGARGDLRDWEIANRPDKGTRLPFTFFAIRVRPRDGESVTPGARGAGSGRRTRATHGYHIGTVAGLPRLARAG